MNTCPLVVYRVYGVLVYIPVCWHHYCKLSYFPFFQLKQGILNVSTDGNHVWDSFFRHFYCSQTLYRQTWFMFYHCLLFHYEHHSSKIISSICGVYILRFIQVLIVHDHWWKIRIVLTDFLLPFHIQLRSYFFHIYIIVFSFIVMFELLLVNEIVIGPESTLGQLMYSFIYQ